MSKTVKNGFRKKFQERHKVSIEQFCKVLTRRYIAAKWVRLTGGTKACQFSCN